MTDFPVHLLLVVLCGEACLGLMVPPWMREAETNRFYEMYTQNIHTSKDVPDKRGTEFKIENNGKQSSYLSPRLPDTLLPYHYNLVMKPYLYDKQMGYTFDGQIEMFIQCVKSTDKIIFNTRHLDMKASSIQILCQSPCHTSMREPRDVTEIKDENDVQTGKATEEETWGQAYTSAGNPRWRHVEEHQDVEQLVVHLFDTLVEGQNYSIRLGFHGQLVSNQVSRGFYWSHYHHQGEERVVAASHFSPVDARRAFPCFDEPAMKATFNISIWRQPHMTTLSNMPLKLTEEREFGWLIDHYEQTPVMSTYTVGFVVCDFPHRSFVTSQGYLVRVWSQPKGLNHTNYAASAVEKLLLYFEAYTGIPYLLTKLDIISVPDHPVAAMENWGLITYRETSLWYDKDSDVSSHQMEVAITLAHEIAHMWFGNLVTPKWWNELWMKEGFATYFTYQALNYVYPDLDADMLLVSRSMHRVMRLDSSLENRPVVNNIVEPRQLMTVFSHQAYSKGASLLRQMCHLITEDVFHICIKKFINDNQFTSVNRFDLWNTCQKVADDKGEELNITSVMEGWVLQPGYPLLTLHTSDDGEVMMNQQQFFDKLYMKNLTGPKTVWKIPLTYISSKDVPLKLSSNTRMRQLMTYPSVGLYDTAAYNGSTDWLLMNIQQTGFYRVNYNEHMWGALVKLLMNNHKFLPVINRAQLLDDAFQLAASGDLNETQVLDLIQYLSEETEWLPWDTTITNIQKVLLLFSYSEDYQVLKGYIMSRLGPLYSRLGWDANIDEESITTKILRHQTIWLMCELGYKPCVHEAKRLFKKWLSLSSFTLKPDQRNTILCAGIRMSGEREWYTVLQKMQSHEYQNQKVDLMNSLACSNKRHLLEEYLDFVLTSGFLTEMEAVTVISSLISNTVGKQVVWEYLRDNWKDFPLRYAKGSVILTLSSALSSKEELEQMSIFHKQNQDFFYDDIFAIAIGLIHENLQWKDRNDKAVSDWIKYNVPKLHIGESTRGLTPQLSVDTAAASVTQCPQMSALLYIGIMSALWKLI